MKSSGIIGLVMLAVIGAMLGDVLTHPAGANAASSAVNGFLGSTYKAASGAYATPGG